MNYEIWNRRYTGSKFKLIDWINEIIDQKCVGESFCDIFAGTGIVSYSVLSKMKKIIINDFLYSNKIIFDAFFLQEKYNIELLKSYERKFQSLDVLKLEENYMSLNFGNKFFSNNDAKIIGEIREEIQFAKELNHKEYAILIASLLYSMDRIANTVGHYEAYIKNKELKDQFSFKLIKPYKTNSKIEIYNKDANLLANEISCDIVYIDPPYSSRQYSRFYHVLENVTKWEKPKLYGTALKPAPENMSDYCKSSAITAFSDLISKLNCKYILVSYNNTYNSKSSSSRNKMELEEMKQILQKKGTLTCFEKEHPYFNAGKTDLKEHKELLFLVEVNQNGNK